MGTHSPLLKGSHTTAHTAKHGAFRTGALLLPSERSTRFGNPAWPDVRTANFAVFGSWPGVLPKNAESLRDSDALMRVAVPRRRGPGGLRDLFRFCRNCGLYTLGFPRKIAHKGTHAETGGVLGGALSLPSTRAARSRTSPGRVSERQTLPLLGLGQEVLSKNAESLRNSDALMCVAVPRRRGPAGLRDLFSFLSKLRFSHSVLRAFRVCVTRGGITTLGVLCVFSKRRTAACQNGSFAVF